MTKDEHKNWDQLFSQLPIDVSPRDPHRESLKEELLGAFSDDSIDSPLLSSKPIKPKHTIGQLLMKYKIPHVTGIAASLAFVAFFLQLSSPALAIDEVLKKIVAAKTAKYKMVFEFAGAAQEIEVLQSEGATRHKHGDQVTIRDMKLRKVLVLSPKSRTASLTTLKTDADLSSQSTNLFVSLQTLLGNKRAKSPKLLGEKDFDGRLLSGFELQISDMALTIWADPATQSPVRIEYPIPGYDTPVLMMDYEANIELDPSLFSMEVPDGYELQKTEVDAGTLPTEDDLLITLKIYSELTGKFPTSLGISGLTKATQAYTEELLKDGNPELQKLQNETVKFTRGFTFSMILMAENDAHYAGAKASPGESKTPIFWYKPKDKTTYRVIYADLSLKDADSAPQVKDAERIGGRQ